jgi:hypothetical protein
MGSSSLYLDYKIDGFQAAEERHSMNAALVVKGPQ